MASRDFHLSSRCWVLKQPIRRAFEKTHLQRAARCWARMLGVHWCSECYLPRACCCALRRAAFGEILEYGNALGLYACVGLGLRT